MSKVDWDDVVAIIETRRSLNAALLQQMIEVRRRYDGDIAIPLPDMDTSPVIPALTPALMAETIDNYAIRAASIAPRVECPALVPMKDQGVKSIEFARIRQKAIYSTWHSNKLRLSLRRMYRHISGYATATMVVLPDYVGGFPAMEVRDPLGAYPEPKAAEDLSPVSDCGFVYERSADYLRRRYPEARRENGGPVGVPGTDTELWDVVEWLDDEQTLIGILGPRDVDVDSYADARRIGLSPSMKLRSWPNLMGRCPVITTPRITLHRVASNVAMQIGNIDLQAKMLALAIAAEERAIFPDRFVIASQNGAPRIISNGGNWADGRTGATNIIENVTTVGQLDSAPPQSTGQAIDRLERNFRVSTGLVPTFGGETYGSLRTGNGMDAMMASAVDPRVQEMQEMVEHGLTHANELILDTWKHCFPEKKTLFMGWAGSAETFELDPPKHIETCANLVAYAITGADVQSATIQLGQLLGMDGLSMRTFRDLHPWIGNAEFEEQQLELEKLNDAAFQGILQQVMAGSMPQMMVVKIAKHRKTGMPILEAIEAADQELRAIQASQAPPPAPPGAPPGEPALVGAPEAQLGLEAGPGGASMQPPAVGPAAAIGPPEGSQGLQQLMTAMRQTPSAR